MNVFSDYARYYDLLYKDKDYAAEATFVLDQLKMDGLSPASVLELGCGTGRHAMEFARLGCQPTGIDLSEQMVTLARERTASAGTAGLEFEVGDVRRWRGGRKFAAVVSLFHVMSYQTSNEDLQAAIETAGAHLDPGGSFLFDFWFGPAVLSDPPAVRVKRMEDNVIKATRLAEPATNCADSTVTVSYEVLVENKQTGSISRLNEQHRMRYLFLPELEVLLNAGGFTLTASGCWMNCAPVSKDCWYAWVIGQKR